MEKVTSPYLISVLKEKSEYFDSQCRTALALSPQLSSTDITQWICEIIEPIVNAFSMCEESFIRRIVEVLWKEMLAFLPTVNTKGNRALYKRCWLLVTKNTELFGQMPERTLTSLLSALETILKENTDKAELWLSYLEKVTPLVRSFDELLDVGRITAWRVGLAHFRKPAMQTAPEISNDIKTVLFPDVNPEAFKYSPWLQSSRTSLSISSFTGFGGYFAAPPLLKKEGEHLFVSDRVNSYALFVDHFGHSLLPCSETFHETLLYEKMKKHPQSGEIHACISKYSDVTSWVYHEGTLFITTASSHSIFVFSGLKHDA